MVDKKVTKSGEYINDALFLLLLAATFYFTRNTICNLLIVAFCGFTLLRMLYKNFAGRFSFYFFGSVTFILYGFINVISGNVLNEDIVITMLTSLAINLVLVFFVAQYIVMSNDIKKVLRLFEWSVFCVAFAVFVMSINTITSGRLGLGTEINSNRLAMLCVYAIAVSIYFLLEQKKRSLLIFNILRIVFMLSIVLLTGSRKGIIMVIIAIVCIFLLSGRFKKLRYILLLAFVAIVLYFLVMKVEVFYNILGVRIEEFFELLESGEMESGSLSDRQTLIEIGLDYIEKKPWTGYGYDCFKLISGIDASSGYGMYSHNNYIEILFGGGIIGLTLYYLPMLYLLISLLRNIKDNKIFAFLAAILISKLAIEYAYVSYYERVDIYVYGILLGVLLHYQSRQKKKI